MQASVKLANEYYKTLSGGGGSALGIPELVKGKWESLAFKPSDLTGLTSALEDQTASFGIPRRIDTAGAVSGIMNSGTSNFMNNNVNVNAGSANPEQVADIVIQRLQIEKLRNIGGQ